MDLFRKKYPVSRTGIDPGTFRLVAQHFTHYATPGQSKHVAEYISTSYTKFVAIGGGILNFESLNFIVNYMIVYSSHFVLRRSQWPRSLRCTSAAAQLLRNSTRGTDVCLLWLLCVLSGRGLCEELITHPEESYRLWCVAVCDLETSWMRWPLSTGGFAKIKIETIQTEVHRNTQHVTAAMCMLCISSPSHKRQPPRLAVKADI